MKSPPSPSPAPRRGRFWLNIGEAAAVLAVVIAGLSYWDAHREHALSEKQIDAQARARTAFVIKGAAEAGGRKIVLEAVTPTQVIQSQRYVFPTVVLDHAMEVTAARPQIDVDWIAAGLAHALDAAHAKGDGEATAPVGIVTTYVEDGETRVDRSLYQIGYAYRSRFLMGRQVALQGISLVQRGVSGDPRSAVDRRWAATTRGSRGS
ncbi:MAG: hypothetical protein H0X27_02905 [Caulobacteraceae bacterium]|nr:hypothetical protein [Caulobacteraceae bacterium]